MAPVASHTVTVFAPAAIAVLIALYKNALSLLVASSAINSTSDVFAQHAEIVSSIALSIASGFLLKRYSI